MIASDTIRDDLLAQGIPCHLVFAAPGGFEVCIREDGAPDEHTLTVQGDPSPAEVVAAVSRVWWEWKAAQETRH